MKVWPIDLKLRENALIHLFIAKIMLFVGRILYEDFTFLHCCCRKIRLLKILLRRKVSIVLISLSHEESYKQCWNFFDELVPWRTLFTQNFNLKREDDLLTWFNEDYRILRRNSVKKICFSVILRSKEVG
jgi:hypothetical protein